LTVTLGNANVGVAEMVGDNSIVGVKVIVGSGVAVRVCVAVTVASGVSVHASVAVITGSVAAACPPVEGAQAETNRKINKMILYILIFSPKKW
jgi:hypothetical protein